MAMDFSNFTPEHFKWELQQSVATVTLNRPDKKNPLTFESYAELRDTFRELQYAQEIKVIVINGAGGNFCSGGDVHEIIGPLTEMEMPALLRFTRMTGDLIRAIRSCPQIVIASIAGVCVGAGAAIAMASDLRFGSDDSSIAFLFTRVGLAGCDMGACSILPRLIGQGRAAELLFSGRFMDAREALSTGFYNEVFSIEDLQPKTMKLAVKYASGPSFAYSMTKKMLDQEWNMGVEQAIESEAQAQAICMQTQDFQRAFKAFASKQKPQFEGN